MLTKGAIGNLINRYKAVLTKCNLINTFGSLAVASMLVLGSAGVASAAGFSLYDDTENHFKTDDGSFNITSDNFTNILNVVDIYGGPFKQNDGNDDTSDSAEAGNIKIIINAPDKTLCSIPDDTGDFWGGAWAQAGHDPHRDKVISTVKNVSIDFSNGTMAGLLFGGGKALNSNTEANADDIYIKITENAVVNEAVIGGGLARAGSNGEGSTTPATVLSNVGNVTIEMDGGTVDGIVGGGFVNSLAGASGATVKSTAKDIDITIRGGTINQFDKKDSIYIEDENFKASVIGGGVMSMRGTNNMDVNRSLVKDDYVGNVIIRLLGGNINGDIIGGSVIDGKNTSTEYIDTAKINKSNIIVATTVCDIYNGSLLVAGAEKTDNIFVNESTITLESGAETGTIYTNDIDNKHIAAKNSTIIYNSSNVKTSSVESDGNANIYATKAFNNDFKSAEAAMAKLVELTGLEKHVLSVREGDINGEASRDANGKVTVKRNKLMDAALQQASVTTVALDKILTNDVRKRLGDIRSDANTTGVWMRWDGGKLKGDSGLTNNFNTIQIGGDTKAAKNCRIGFAGSFTHGDTDFSRGNGELEGFSFALYGTWMGENGMFADVVARLGKFSTEMNVDGNKGDMDNRVASLSGEYGWRFNVCDQFFVEPQVELAYTYVSSDDLQLGNNHYEFDNVDSLTGRAGVVAGWQLPEERGNVYARASVVQQFMGDAKISGTNGVADNVQEIDGEDTWLEYGIGANVKLTDSTYVWADVERTEGADIEEEWRGTVGVRFSF